MGVNEQRDRNRKLIYLLLSADDCYYYYCYSTQDDSELYLFSHVQISSSATHEPNECDNSCSYYYDHFNLVNFGKVIQLSFQHKYSIISSTPPPSTGREVAAANVEESPLCARNAFAKEIHPPLYEL